MPGYDVVIWPAQKTKSRINGLLSALFTLRLTPFNFEMKRDWRDRCPAKKWRTVYGAYLFVDRSCDDVGVEGIAEFAVEDKF